MTKQSVQKSVSLIGLLITCLSSNTVLAQWNNDSASNGYNPGYGNFPPEDIDQRLSEQADYGTGQDQAQGQDQNQRQNNPWSTPPLNKHSTDGYSADKYPLSEYAAPGTNQSPGTYSQRNYTQQTDLPSNSGEQSRQQPYQQSYQQQPYNPSPYGAYPTAPQTNNSSNNRSMSFNNPWSNNNSSFSMPWGNNSSGGNIMPDMMPGMMHRGNNDNGASKNPWDNTRNNYSTNFTAPWSNKSWSNKSSNFSMPWGGNNSGFNPWKK